MPAPLGMKESYLKAMAPGAKPVFDEEAYWNDLGKKDFETFPGVDEMGVVDTIKQGLGRLNFRGAIGRRKSKVQRQKVEDANPMTEADLATPRATQLLDTQKFIAKALGQDVPLTRRETAAYRVWLAQK